MNDSDQNSSSHSRGLREARFLFQAGIGASMTSLLWVYLTSEDWEPVPVTLLPLILVGILLPLVAVPVPAHLVSSATASGRYLLAAALLMAGLAVAVVVGRLLFSWDRIFGVLLAGPFFSIGIVAQTFWGRIWDEAVDSSGQPGPKDGRLSFAGWIAGALAAPLTSLLAGSPLIGLWLGALGLVAGGWMVRRQSFRNPSANWLSNRSARQLFAAIENAARAKGARMVLFRIFWFYGVVISVLAMAPGGWKPGPNREVLGGISEASYLGFAAIVIALIAGFAGGGFRAVQGAARRYPSLSLGLICLILPASMIGLVILPGWISPPLAFLIGTGAGMVLGAASRDLRACLGERFAAESEIIHLTAAAAGGIAFCVCFWLGHAVAGFGPMLLSAASLLFAAFALVWHRRWSESPLPDQDRGFDPWYPGKLSGPGAGSETGFLISIAYEIPAERREAFLDATRDLANLRQKQGALFWTLSESEEHSEILKEQFIVGSLDDYQEAVRAESREDREIKQRIFDLNDWDSLPAESRNRLLEG